MTSKNLKKIFRFWDVLIFIGIAIVATIASIVFAVFAESLDGWVMVSMSMFVIMSRMTAHATKRL